MKEEELEKALTLLKERDQAEEELLRINKTLEEKALYVRIKFSNGNDFPIDIEEAKNIIKKRKKILERLIKTNSEEFSKL